MGSEVDFGRLIKIYGKDSQGRDVVMRSEKQVVVGNPDVERICTSHVERQNLAMRMNMRRFTRLTNAFSKKVENHAAMISIHFLNYNFIRKHATIKDAPAVAANVCESAYKMEELIEEFDSYRGENYPVNRPKKYRKRSTVPRSYEPATEPKTQWYLKPNSKQSQAINDEISKKNSN